MSTQQPTLNQRPEFGKLFGLTYHPETKAPVVKTKRVLKVGLGIPKGRAIQVFLFGGRWHIRHGAWESSGGKEKLVMKTVYQGGAVVNGIMTPNTKEAAEAWHNANKHTAAISNRPQKVPYFTFSRRSVTEEDGKVVEVFEPDFDAIEAHGDIPRRIPVVLTSDNPLYQEYAWWSASKLECHGDGILAERAISAGSAKDPGWQDAKAAGQKMFLYSPCFKTGCSHAGTDCKPHSTLNLQLAYALRLGVTAYFASTGQVTADGLFSSLWEIRECIERLGCSIAGAPVDLVLGTFRANKDGKSQAQPWVGLELRAEGVASLRQKLQDTAWTPAQLNTAQQQIAAAPEIEAEAESIAFDASAAQPIPALPDAVEPDFDDEEPEPLPPAASATHQKQDQVLQKLREQREKVVAIQPQQTQQSALPPVPWKTRMEMNAVLGRAKQQLGDAVFNAALSRHEVMVGTLAHDDPKAALVFADLLALAEGATEEELF